MRKIISFVTKWLHITVLSYYEYSISEKKKKLACTLALLDTMHTEVGMREMHFRVRLIKGMRRNQKLKGKEQKMPTIPVFIKSSNRSIFINDNLSWSIYLELLVSTNVLLHILFVITQVKILFRHWYKFGSDDAAVI